MVQIVCHLDYKSFLDNVLDKSIQIPKGHAAQLQYKFELATEAEMEAYPDRFPMGTKVNYRKCSQQFTTKMWPCECERYKVEVYKVYLMTSDWQPESTPYEDLRAPGISFFKEKPVGHPPIMPFASGAHANFMNFMYKVRTNFFVQEKFSDVKKEWEEFAAKVMPSSDDVNDYLRTHQVRMPLSKCLWRPDASFRSHVEAPSTITMHDAFTDVYESRKSPLDLRVEETLRQGIPIISNRFNLHVPKIIIWRHRVRGHLVSVEFPAPKPSSSSSSSSLGIMG